LGKTKNRLEEEERKCLRNYNEISFIGNINTVSVWRSYFVANEYSEIQTFRRINVTLQLIFVLLLLKVGKIVCLLENDFNRKNLSKGN
jgi:hypothetical protein